MFNAKTPNMADIESKVAPGRDADIDFSKIFAVLKQGGRRIILWGLSFVVLGALYLMTATPKFDATAEIIIDTQTSRAMQKPDLTDTTAIDTSMVDSQVEVLTSDETARSVIRALHLDTDPEFVGPQPGFIGAVRTFISTKINAVRDMLGAGPKDPDNPEARAVVLFDKQLSVKRTGLTYVISITMRSNSASKSAAIANEVANVYFKSVLDAKYNATKQTGEWLQNRLAEIRAQATEADRAVEVFKSRNNIVDTNRGLLSEQQLGELNSQLALAQAATAEAKARLGRAQEVAQDPLSQRTVTETLNNAVVSRLRAQYLDLAARAGDLAARFGPKHGVVVTLRQQMDQIKSAALSQIKQIVDADESDYEVALAREQSLTDSLNKLVSNSDSSSIAQVKLKDLESSADSYRTLYNSYLQKYQEATQRESFPISDARLVTPAVPPLQKSSPNALLIIAGGLALGLFFGVGNVVARTAMDGSFVSPEDMQDQTGAALLGILPMIEKAKKGSRRNPHASPGTAGSEASAFNETSANHVLDFPYSRFTEAVRNVKLSIDAVETGVVGKVVALTSSVPGEGKTTVAINLAQLLASPGKRVLLIDADLTRRSLTSKLVKIPRTGLLQVLRDRASLASMTMPSTVPELDILPCVNEGRIKDRAELLASKAFADMLDEARRTYNYVILDMAPILPVVDTKVAARLVDCFLMVTEWRVTSRKVVMEAVATEGVRDRILGIIVNKVDRVTLAQLDAHRGAAFSRYYA